MADYAPLIRPTICRTPSGKSFGLSEHGVAYVKSSPQKYFSSVFRKGMFDCLRPAFTRGAFRDRHERGRRDAMAVSARQTSASMRTAKSCRPDPATLGSSLARRTRGDGGQKARRTEEPTYKP